MSSSTFETIVHLQLHYWLIHQNKIIYHVIIIDVAITGIDGQSRTSDEHTDRPLQVRHEQRRLNMAPSQIDIICNSYHRLLIQDNSRPFKSFVMEQIRHKLIAFEGKAKVSRIKVVMKWWTKCISMVIAKTASRNVAFKSDKLMDAYFEKDNLVRKRLKRF